jgi:hypothetical protein
MYIVALFLFLLGMFATGISFSIPGWEAVVFVGGILCVSAAIAIPVHSRWK